MYLIRSSSQSYETETNPHRAGHRRLPLHPVIRFEVMMRDQRRCTDVSTNGIRCNETRDLEIHHIIEIANGGDNSIENLTTLCSRHHQQRHPHFTISSQRPNRQRDRFGQWIRERTVEYCA